MELFVGKLECLLLVEVALRPDALEKIHAEIPAKGLFEDIRIALARPRGQHACAPQEVFLYVNGCLLASHGTEGKRTTSCLHEGSYSPTMRIPGRPDGPLP
jgi:hypothetical protein